MNEVNNRKLFKPRNARNKLNQMGGIMASDAELMQTVARYNMGGPVQTFRDGGQPLLGGNLPQRPATTFSGTPQQFRMLPRAVQQQVLDAENTQRGIAGSLATAGKFASIPIELGYGTVTGAYDLAKRGLQGVGLADPSVEEETRPLGLFGMFDEMREKGAPIQNVEELQGILAMQQGEVDPAIQRAMEQDAAAKEQEAVSTQLGQDVFGEGYGMSPEDQAFMMPGVTPSQMPEEKQVITPEAAPEVTTGDGAARDEGRAGMAAADPQIIAAKKGELGPKAQVEAIVAAGTQEEQEKSVKDLMAEFTQNAPQYEGMDKGLAIAKIGFAMAAGKSSNALTNIASALEQGADMFIKDKKDRDAFNRQVQLSALQYGMGEIGKRRSQDRLDKRTFREFVAGKDGIEYNGQKYKEGETILVSQEAILDNNGRIPEGLQDKAVYAAGIKAAADKNKAFNDAVQKMTEEAVLPDSAATKITEQYGAAVSNFQSAEVGVQLLENAIVDVAEGKVTGFTNGFGSAMNKVANAAGVDLGQEFESVDEFKATLRRAFQKLIPTTLGEAQSANSISNRDVEFLADAYINAGALQNGVFSLAFVDEDVLVGQLQGAIGEFRKSQRGSLDQMTTLESRLYGRTLPGTRASASTLVDPYRESMSPYMPGQTGTQAGLVRGDDGVFRLQ